MSTTDAVVTALSRVEQPIRAEVFGIERLEQHAESLAAAQPTADERATGRRLLPRVRENGRVLVLDGLVPRRPGFSKRSHLRATVRDVQLASLQVLMALATLAHRARYITDAVLRTLGRLYITKRRLLEWVSAAQASYGVDLTLRAAPALKQMLCGSAQALLESSLRPDEVMDLVPVRPLADDEASIRQAYRDRLTALYGKIKP